MALISEGSYCTASKHGCNKAFDGYSFSTNSEHQWAFFGKAQGNWIKVNFNRMYAIYTLRFMQLAVINESHFEDLLLTFGDGSQIVVTLISCI